jgi:hypothetical protein
MRLSLRILAIGAVVALLAAPALTADPSIEPGSDLWVTPADGSSFTTFDENPLPRGFFCAGSAPFTGKIAFKGAPLATQPAGLLGRTDTIVERLDDAYFDEHGVATTRIQLRALSLVGIEPLRNECGEFNVSMTLAGDQPTTTMTIVQTHERGGIYHAPLSLNVRITFTPVAGGRALSVEKRVNLGPAPGARWQFAHRPEQPVRRFIGKPFVRVNTDDVAGPDTFVPLASNFQVVTRDGVRSTSGALQECILLVEPDTSCEDPNCHTDGTSSHCTCDGGCTYY